MMYGWFLPLHVFITTFFWSGEVLIGSLMALSKHINNCQDVHIELRVACVWGSQGCEEGQVSD